MLKQATGSNEPILADFRNRTFNALSTFENVANFNATARAEAINKIKAEDLKFFNTITAQRKTLEFQTIEQITLAAEKNQQPSKKQPADKNKESQKSGGAPQSNQDPDKDKEKKKYFSPEAIAKGIEYLKDGNKIRHIFENPDHKLGLLLNKFKTHELAIGAVLNAASGKLPDSGLFEDVVIRVDEYEVYIRGVVMNGIPKIGTMFIK